MSGISEYLFNSTWKIQNAATSSLRLMISHGLAKIVTSENQHTEGCQKVLMNIKYFISTRFTEPGNANALGNSLSIIKTIVEKMYLDDQVLCGMLLEISNLNVGKNQYSTWTSCVGAFMAKMGGKKFFSVLPLKLIDFDFFSLSYAQDSRSWVLPLIEHNLKIDANLDFFVEYFMPMVLQLNKLRELEEKARGSAIKVKKYETLLVQIW